MGDTQSAVLFGELISMLAEKIRNFEESGHDEIAAAIRELGQEIYDTSQDYDFTDIEAYNTDSPDLRTLEIGEECDLCGEWLSPLESGDGWHECDK